MGRKLPAPARLRTLARRGAARRCSSVPPHRSRTPPRMPPDRFLVILNPTAGRGNGGRYRDLVDREMDRAGASHRIVETEGPGHAAALAEEAVRAGWPAVVAVGGDGTVHEVVNGLLRAAGDGPTVPLGIVGVGSGNDFARLAGVSRSPAEAVRRLSRAVPRAVDVGSVNGEWFTNGVGVGLDARVAIEVARHRRLRGLAMYLAALPGALRRWRAPRMRVEIDGEVVHDGAMTLVTVGNGGRHGGGFWICPEARIDDGLLDVCACDELSTLGILRFLPRVLRGTHVGQPAVHMHRGRSVRITGADPLPVHADGEIVAHDARELEILIHPGRLRVLV
jgi:diacylglycerol kinase (ATP)